MGTSAKISPTVTSLDVAIIGGGPAGLMAAERLAEAGITVDLFDALPSVGRKILIAGKGGLNLTHAEPRAAFLSRYGARQTEMTPLIDAFPPEALRQWAHGLGIDTFVGSSSRVFPKEMKAAPLLRAWLSRLRRQGVRFHMRHRWLGWSDDGKTLRFNTPEGERQIDADVTLLALGGGSWPKLGSNGDWVTLLGQRGITITPLQPANCGFDVDWSAYFKERFVGHPLKRIAIELSNTTVVHSAKTEAPESIRRLGECVVSEHGLEGSLIYALSASIRNQIAQQGQAVLHLDLLPDWSHDRVQQAVAHPRGSRSWSSHLQSRLGLTGVKVALLRECAADAFDNSTSAAAQSTALASAIKALPITLLRPRPLAEAISSAGGVPFEALDASLMLRTLPGVFCAGEMLDWEAPTGGYLLTGCFASGRAAAQEALRYLNTPATDREIL